MAISAVTFDYNNSSVSSIEYSRNRILDSIRSIRRRYHREYGEVVICTDEKNSWRLDIFPYYKAKRKKQRDESVINWDAVYENINIVKEELAQYFPYKVVSNPRTEADDIIGVLSHYPGRHLIVSNDKDFLQLTALDNVRVYQPRLGEIVKCEDPNYFLFEHICKGDSGDGITNILSDDDTLITPGKRQKPVSQKKLFDWYISRDEFLEQHRDKYLRNKSIISLFDVPENIKAQISASYDCASVAKRSGLLNFFIKNKLHEHISRIGDF